MFINIESLLEFWLIPRTTLFYFHDHVWLRFIKTESLLFHSWVDSIDLFYLGQIVSFYCKFLNEIQMGSQKMFTFFFLFAMTFWFSLALKWNLTLRNDIEARWVWACLIFDLSKTQCLIFISKFSRVKQKTCETQKMKNFNYL